MKFSQKRRRMGLKQTKPQKIKNSFLQVLLNERHFWQVIYNNYHFLKPQVYLVTFEFNFLGWSLRFQQFSGAFIKCALHALYNWKIIALQLLLPAVMTIFAAVQILTIPVIGQQNSLGTILMKSHWAWI